MDAPINSTKAAALIQSATGRPCSRQNLEKLCAHGGLQGSPCIVQAKPLRLDPALLVPEYLAKVGPHQSETVQPRMKRELPRRQDVDRPRQQLPDHADGELPESVHLFGVINEVLERQIVVDRSKVIGGDVDIFQHTFADRHAGNDDDEFLKSVAAR